MSKMCMPLATNVTAGSLLSGGTWGLYPDLQWGNTSRPAVPHGRSVLRAIWYQTFPRLLAAPDVELAVVRNDVSPDTALDDEPIVYRVPLTSALPEWGAWVYPAVSFDGGQKCRIYFRPPVAVVLPQINVVALAFWEYDFGE